MEDLANCRLVNKFWNQISTKYFRQSHKWIDLFAEMDLENLYRDLENTLNFPFSKFSIRPFDVRMNYIPLFFEKHGTFVQRLSLVGDYPYYSEPSLIEFQNNVKLIIRNVPNLEHLTIADFSEELVSTPFFETEETNQTTLEKLKCLRLYLDLQDGVHPQFMANLFKLASNLERLTLYIPWYNTNEQDLFIPGFSKLKRLKMNNNNNDTGHTTFVSSNLIRNLTVHKILFEELFIGIDFTSHRDASDLVGFFSLQKHSLKFLRLESTRKIPAQFSFQ